MKGYRKKRNEATKMQAGSIIILARRPNKRDESKSRKDLRRMSADDRSSPQNQEARQWDCGTAERKFRPCPIVKPRAVGSQISIAFLKLRLSAEKCGDCRRTAQKLRHDGTEANERFGNVLSTEW